MKPAELDQLQLDTLATRPPQGTTWAVFAVLVIVARTLLRIEKRLSEPTAL